MDLLLGSSVVIEITDWSPSSRSELDHRVFEPGVSGVGSVGLGLSIA